MQEKIRKYGRTFVSVFFIGICTYFLLISRQLTNGYDGLWEYSDYTAGYWELSLGRWFWLYIDQLRFGISTEPITSLMSIALYALGIVIVIEIFNVSKMWQQLLVGILFLSNPAICGTLAYRYMSPTFAIAFLLNVVAASVVSRCLKRMWITVLFAGVMIGLGMGAYQANIGCYVLVFVCYIVFLLLKEEVKEKEVLIVVARGILALVIGAIVYILGLTLHLRVFHTSLSDYNGANTYSLLNSFKSLRHSVPNAYHQFAMYFWGETFLQHIYQPYYIYAGVLLVALLILICKIHLMTATKRWRGYVSFVFIAMIPLACNAVFLISTNVGLAIQMATPLALCIPVLLALVLSFQYEKKLERGLFVAFVMSAVFLAYGSFYQVQLDQNAMDEGTKSSSAIVSQIVQTIISEEMFEEKYEYCFIGVPSGNPMFSVSSLYSRANYYANFGCWWADGNSAKSWKGLVNNVCRYDMNMVSPSRYLEILQREEVKNMSVYPAKDSIVCIDNTVIVKVAP